MFQTQFITAERPSFLYDTIGLTHRVARFSLRQPTESLSFVAVSSTLRVSVQDENSHTTCFVYSTAIASVARSLQQSRAPYTVKNVRIFSDILWRMFHIFAEPVTCTFACVYLRNNEAHWPTLQCGPTLRYSVDLRMQTCTEGSSSVKLRRTTTKYLLIYG